jgi:hypothetical protein
MRMREEMKCFFVDEIEMPCLWQVMWFRLGELEGDRFCRNQCEVWQYMGSKVQGSDFIHTFRHRCHPKTNDREYRHIAIAIIREK